jgi:hypothetical protein
VRKNGEFFMRKYAQYSRHQQRGQRRVASTS